MNVHRAHALILRLPGLSHSVFSAGKISSWRFSPASSFSRPSEWISPSKRKPSLPSEPLSKPSTFSSPFWPSLSPRFRFFRSAYGLLLWGLLGRLIVHGHTPIQSGVPDQRLNRLNIDTGAVYGQSLTAAVFDKDITDPCYFLRATPAT